nr:MAG: BrnA antitoxin of type II toxin-antitoxin system [Candidatus Kentron sp. FM]
MENTPVSIRLSNEVVSYFRATGKGWQTRVDEVLEEWMAARHSV